MTRRQWITGVLLGSLVGTVWAAGPSETNRLTPVSEEDFLKSALGKTPEVHTWVAGLGRVPPASSDKNRNPRFFLSRDQQVAVVEDCLISASSAVGLYILTASKNRDYYPWYAPAFNQWACNEGCNEEEDCFYEAPGPAPNAPVHRLNYHYEINLQSGQYDLELNPGHPIKVLKKQTADLT
jgi:hypothetical protein